MHVAIADDHPIVRAGLLAVLAAAFPNARFSEAASTEAALNLAGAGDLDVLLLDVEFTGEKVRGTDIVPRIAKAPNAPRILLLTTYAIDADIQVALQHGAGYILKGSDPAFLVQSVQQTASAQPAYAPEVLAKMTARITQQSTALTTRELDVLTQLAAGKSNAEIAGALFLSQATVKTHLGRIFDKLSVNSRSAAVAEALRRGIIRPA